MKLISITVKNISVEHIGCKGTVISFMHIVFIYHVLIEPVLSINVHLTESMTFLGILKIIMMKFKTKEIICNRICIKASVRLAG